VFYVFKDLQNNCHEYQITFNTAVVINITIRYLFASNCKFYTQMAYVIAIQIILKGLNACKPPPKAKAVRKMDFDFQFFSQNGALHLPSWLSITSPFDSPSAISYRWSIITESVSKAIFEITGPKHIGSQLWPFRVTWHFRVMWRQWSSDHSIFHMPFSIGAPLEPSQYLQPFSKCSAPTHVNENTN